MRCKNLWTFPSLAIAALSLATSGCATSGGSADVAKFDGGSLPANVYVEAKSVTKLPAGKWDVATAKKVMAKLRRSELRKVKALNDAIWHDDRVTKYLRKRGVK